MSTNGARARRQDRPGSETSLRKTKQTAPEDRRAKSSLLEREEEYKRLNAELEAKTAELVREAEAIMTEQENFLLNSSPQSRSASHSPESQESQSVRRSRVKSPTHTNHGSMSLTAKFGLFDSDDDEDDQPPQRPQAKTSARSTASSASTGRKMPRIPAKPGVITAPNSRPGSKKAAKRGLSAKSYPRRAPSAADEVAIPDDFAAKLTLANAISNIETNFDDEAYSARDDDDIMPAAAAEMGSEAQIRFLKAKLRVMQEELERLAQDCRSGADERSKLNSALKEANEEQSRLQKTNNAQQTQIEKHKKLLEDEKKKSDAVGTQVQSLRKELESLRREQKQSSVTHNATEVRLNRALEEVERFKSQMQKDKHANKESSDQERREMERLRSDNKRLERLKNDMSTVFKKQQKLISILKRQILHIEAAKLLSFTEQEFVKALDWGNK